MLTRSRPGGPTDTRPRAIQHVPAGFDCYLKGAPLPVVGHGMLRMSRHAAATPSVNCANASMQARHSPPVLFFARLLHSIPDDVQRSPRSTCLGRTRPRGKDFLMLAKSGPRTLNRRLLDDLLLPCRRKAPGRSISAQRKREAVGT